jgi:hypothetical protein
MTPRHACFALSAATLAALTWAAEPVGGAGLRSQSGASEARADLRAGRGIGQSSPLESRITIGGLDRFQLLGAHEKPSLSPLRRGPALGEVPPSAREREMAQLRRGADAQTMSSPITLGASGRR